MQHVALLSRKRSLEEAVNALQKQRGDLEKQRDDLVTAEAHARTQFQVSLPPLTKPKSAIKLNPTLH